MDSLLARSELVCAATVKNGAPFHPLIYFTCTLLQLFVSGGATVQAGQAAGVRRLLFGTVNVSSWDELGQQLSSDPFIFFDPSRIIHVF